MLDSVVPLSAFLFTFADTCSFAVTLDDLQQLEIICYVPSYLPQGMRLKRIDVTYDEMSADEDQKHRLPLYSIEYRNGWNATFSIESAREGIGDRNIMSDEKNTDETEIKSPIGPMYLIYRPKGKDGRDAHNGGHYRVRHRKTEDSTRRQSFDDSRASGGVIHSEIAAASRKK